MGYATHYSLKVELTVNAKTVELKDDAHLTEIIAALRSECEGANYALDEEGDSSDSSKWYEHQADMKAFSAKHPQVLFTLHGEGEENEDIWNEYYLGGKMQVAKAKMQIAPFNPKELK